MLDTHTLVNNVVSLTLLAAFFYERKARADAGDVNESLLVWAKHMDTLSHCQHLLDQRVAELKGRFDALEMKLDLSKGGAYMDLKEYLEQQLNFAHRDWQAMMSRADELKKGMGTARFNWEAEAIQKRINLLHKHQSMYCLMRSDEEAANY